ESLIPTIASDPDPATQRTLRDKSWEYAFDGTYTIPVGDSGGSLAFNGSVEKSLSKGRDGYNIILLTDPGANTERRVVNPDDIIRQKSETLTFSSGATLNHPLGSWQLTATMDGSIAHSKNFNDRRLDTSDLVAGALAGDFAIDGMLPVLPSADRDLAETTSRTFNSLATANGVLLWMPAGEVSATLRSGYSLTNFESMDTRNPGIETSLTRHSLSAGGNLGIPLTSRREGVLSGIGDISLNLNGGITDLSDFGTLYDYTVGMFWSPTESLSLQASYIYAEAAPSLTQLGSPTIVNENVAVYDFANNETVLIETTSGGNPLLARETRKDIRLSAQWDLPFLSDARLQVDYNVNRSYDIASGFPGILTPEIESAFSDRVTRDIDGTLLALDLRPVTFARQTSRRIRYGINMGFQLGGSREQEERPQQSGNGAAPAAAQGGGSAVGPNGPAAPGGFGGGQGGPPGGFGGGQGGGNFDPARFQALRERLCAGTGDVQLSEEEIAQLPPFIVNQVRNEAGEIDQAQLNALRDRFCSADAQIVGGPGQPGGNFDPARFDAIRQRICAAPEGELPDLTDLPEPMLQRLRGEDGEIDPERFAALRAQMCAGGDAAGQQPGPGGGGFFRFGGPPGGGPPGGGGAPGAGRGPGGGGSGPPIGAIIGRMTGGGGGGGRMFVNLFHTIELENELLIAEGLPVLDLLDGDALSGGGTVRHSAELEGGIFMNGKGMRFSGRYSGKSRIDGSGMPGSSNLYFGSLLTLDLRAFVDLDQQPKLVEKIPLLKGTRISFSVDNVFDARRKVVDDNGEVPLRYQPGLIDPVGRFFEIEFRKLF
ncbi:MAG TPA: hypothetical protein VLA37_03235, partial [Sphingomonadaceae bacterium]|nr:hypothetical protein [Sphingomonadaceae bacterium]